MRKVIALSIGLLAIIFGLLLVFVVVSSLIYSPEYVRRVLAYRQSDYLDYMNHFPSRPLAPAPEPFHFVEAPAGIH